MTFEEFIQFVIRESTHYFTWAASAIQWVLVAFAAIAIALTPGWFARPLRALRDLFVAVAGRKAAAVAICGILPVAVRLSLLGVMPVPYPSIHDEYSHLLLADTLAHGRWTNPTPAMWQHFETIHVIQKPTYNSMYPPGQGAMLALGQVVFGNPWAGALISVGLMFAALCWMLQGWLPPAWALFGTLVAMLEFGILTFWMNSYMGGSVAAIGGALLVGALPRLRRRPEARDALLVGLGMVVLMNTRPFEGAMLSAAVLLYLAPALRRAFASDRRRLIAVLWPAAAVVACGFVFLGFYSWKVTGNPLRMPYQVNRDTYGWPENLAFLKEKQVVFRHKALADMYKMETERRRQYLRPEGFVDSLNVRLFDNWSFFLGPPLTVPLIYLAWLFRDRRTRPLMVLWLLLGVLNLGQLVLYPYHLAPVVPLVFAAVAQGSRHLYVQLGRSSRARARAAVLALLACPLVVNAMRLNAVQLNVPLSYWETGYESHRDARQDIEEWLNARARKQLVIVHYSAGHSPNQEWVYNRADIDDSKVVWARDMDRESNDRLVAHYPDRESWVLNADEDVPHVIRYDRAVREQSSIEAASH